MVSLRRRRLMGISTAGIFWNSTLYILNKILKSWFGCVANIKTINVAGVWSSFLPELTVDYSNTSSVPPIPFDDLNIHVENVSFPIFMDMLQNAIKSISLCNMKKLNNV